MDKCYHCGDPCASGTIKHRDKSFCCKGCATVFDILHDNDLSYYYELQDAPGISPKISESKYAYLDKEEIIEKLVEFTEDGVQVVSFVIPSMHCSSCIWVLEHLHKLEPNVRKAFVNFPKKSVRITYDSSALSLREVVELLTRLGYEPNISLEDMDKKKVSVDRSLIYKLGIAGFAFGNIMSLSIPEYFDLNDFWLEQFRPLFRYLMFAFSLPVVFYSGSDYFINAYKGLRSKVVNIDFPLALGIAVLFIRSTYEVFLDSGTGFFDSLSGLVFFLLLGKFFQQKTYAFLSFERDYKSYFPIAVTLLRRNEQGTEEEQMPVFQLQKGDRVLLRNEELLPADAILIKGEAHIDYSFVTGESQPVRKNSGDKVYAGGRQQGDVLELEITKPVEQSYLTQLWSDEVFAKSRQTNFRTLTDSISQRFTIAILLIAVVSTSFWLFYDASKALQVFTAVLIIACPCAIALSAPFTLGNLLRIYGKHEMYLKDAEVIERMAKVDTIVFDKTGTITSSKESNIAYEGNPIPEELLPMIVSVLRGSNHPLSRGLYEYLDKVDAIALDNFVEHTGKGMEATYKDCLIKIGSASFVGVPIAKEEINQTRVFIKVKDTIYGSYVFQNAYRDGVEKLFSALRTDDQELIVLSGDNDGEYAYLQTIFPKGTKMYFNQTPGDKLQFIKDLQTDAKSVMMVGDGLNDAGALAQSDVGIVVSENVNVFSPACDGIMAASKLIYLDRFIALSKRGVQIIKWSFLFSLFYNIIGTSFAVTGNLMPVVAAVLMPISSISIVAFTTFGSRLSEKILNKDGNPKHDKSHRFKSASDIVLQKS